MSQVMDRTRSPRTPTVGGVVCRAAAAASIASGAIHFSVVGEHYTEAWYFGVFFMLAAFAQVLWAVVVIARPTRRVLVAGMALQVALVGIYLWTRTTGLPIGPEPWQPEDVAFLDIMATLFEVIAAGTAILLIARPLDRPISRRLSLSTFGMAALLIAALTSASLASGSSEASGMSGMADGSAGSSMAGMPGMDGATPSGTPLSLATNSPAGNIAWPASMGEMEGGMQMAGPACTAAPTAGQQQAAVDLVNQTVADTTQYRSLTAAKAAGYVPITPSGRPVVHYVNPIYYAQTQSPSQVLNPQAPQSLVYANTKTGPVLVAAMYIMPNGASADATPDPGGCLTQWHIHTNLCFNGRSQVVGVDSSGTCPTGSANRTTQPMMHVWVAPVPGGPLTVDATNRQIVDAAKTLSPVDPPSVRA
jgi:hypothetical protein